MYDYDETSWAVELGDLRMSNQITGLAGGWICVVVKKGKNSGRFSKKFFTGGALIFGCVRVCGYCSR